MNEVILDDSVSEAVLTEVPKKRGNPNFAKKEVPVNHSESDLPPSCLRNEKVSARFIPKDYGMITNTKHPLYGGLANDAKRVFTVPMLTNGQYVNILTNDEKTYLEYVMGLEVNALSIYLKNNNYWDNYQVRLIKGDNLFDLRDPNDYINYKVLLANKDFIAPSLQVLQDLPKVTYEFVLVAEEEEEDKVSREMNATMNSYLELGKIVEDVDTMRVIIEILSGRPTGINSKLEFLQTQCNKLIQADARQFMKTIKDPLLPNKVLIKRAKDNNVITTKGSYYYYNGDPLCGPNEEPTLTIAAKWLGLPKNSELKYTIEAKIK
jgi:hypothetical protein